MIVCNPESKTVDYRNSVFLAGPVTDWRDKIIRILMERRFRGTVLNPVVENYSAGLEQTSWEALGMDYAERVLFWIDKTVDTPCFATMFELGRIIRSGKCIVGMPQDNVNEYVQTICGMNDVSVHHTLDGMTNELMAHLSRPRMRFFTSDTHFGIQYVLKNSFRPFRTVDEMDSEMISRWNGKITMNDIVYHLGDFGKAEFVKHLNFSKMILMLGNHERRSTESSKSTRERLRNLEELLLDKRVSVLDSIDLHDSTAGHMFRLVHQPVGNPQSAKTFPNTFYLFGHVHGAAFAKRNGMNVGMDCNNYAPLSLDEMRRKAVEVMAHSDSNWFFDPACHR